MFWAPPSPPLSPSAASLSPRPVAMHVASNSRHDVDYAAHEINRLLLPRTNPLPRSHTRHTAATPDVFGVVATSPVSLVGISEWDEIRAHSVLPSTTNFGRGGMRTPVCTHCTPGNCSSPGLCSEFGARNLVCPLPGAL